ncbi:hypothetical protein BVRB_6g129720 [Beta vulgaris subsp. vulgaris]|nr:hypothetical protein BVRB_6g129720 [Beta vulgaris subsp. vulgaris]
MSHNNTTNNQPSLLLLLFTLTTFFFYNATSKTYYTDITVLKLLKQSISTNSLTPGSCISSWDFSYDPCDSLFSDKFTCGFTCDRVNSSNITRVTELGLDQASYSASLSSIPWNNLQFLRSLDLTGNAFHGNIPDSLSNLTRLTRLVLSRNSLSGSIPNSLSQLGALEEIYLDYNSLVGPIPGSFRGLRGLKRVELQGNQLSGEFPDLSRLTQLEFLDTSENLITGRVPTNLPSSLTEISMRKNLLSGDLPGEILRNLPFLQVLDLSFNQLSGLISASFFTHSVLQQVSLSNNKLTSIEVPSGLGADSGLIAIDLSNNELSGLLPGFMGLMPKLSALTLENNKFMGLIPTTYALKMVWAEPGVVPFERLLLGGNYLFGPIPDPLMKLEPGSTRINLVDNCLLVCPNTVFFCQGGDQKSVVECRTSLGPVIPYN